jgi:hypothetical protein
MIIDLEDLAREVLNEFHGMTAGHGACGVRAFGADIFCCLGPIYEL